MEAALALRGLACLGVAGQAILANDLGQAVQAADSLDLSPARLVVRALHQMVFVRAHILHTDTLKRVLHPNFQGDLSCVLVAAQGQQEFHPACL